MTTINGELRSFLSSIEQKHDTLRFLHNTRPEDFIPGKSPVFYSGPYWDRREIEALFEAVLTGKWITSGEHVHHFERRFSRMFNTGHSVMVNSGSSANLVLIGALKKFFDWQDEDEIILSVVGFPTTLAPVIQHRLKPVFVDIELDSLNFDVGQIEERITPRTRAVFVSPVLGNAPDMDRIQEICSAHGLQLVLDNCDSLGSRWRGRYLNELAVASSCSFYPAHHISTGEGGMMSSTHEEMVKIARSLASWGRDCWCVGTGNLLPNGTCKTRFSPWLAPAHDGVVDHKYVFTNVGYNLKPLDLQGALGSAQLDKFEEIDARRRQSKRRLQALIERHLPGVHVPVELPQAQTCWFGTPLVCPDRATKERLVQHFESHRIQTRNYFAGNVLLQPGYRNLGKATDYPQANAVLDRVFFIGAAPHYGEAVFDYVESVLRKAVNINSKSCQACTCHASEGAE